MLQGTGSHAGKTVLVAGLCRVLSRRGLRVAPFKSQNMALNAHVTSDGGEMGWAQAMQAEAAGVEPRVEMNPILLKPRSEARSQVIFLGKVLGDHAAADYYELGLELWPGVEASYRGLAREADVVIIEGAGSPAEPNLMSRDLANMRVARMAHAPVLIVGDIDRGGVFASLVGTMVLLRAADQKLVSGFILNKFRGDASLLTRAVEDLTRRTGRRVLGVVPFLPRLRLPEEDSVALEAHRPVGLAGLGVAVVRLPHIANFTDFAPLEAEPGLRLVYAAEPRDLAGAALVILPGSKDTMFDLRFLRTHGFPSALRSHLAAGGVILGVCGGYQMLGRSVGDPFGVESGGSEAGLGLLPVRTVLQPRKTTRRVRARWLPDGPSFEAYEIHMGATTRENDGRALLEVDGSAEGCASGDGRVWGTYLHGLFESRAARQHVLAWAGTRDVAPGAAPAADHREEREAAYDLLAETLAQVLDLAALDRLLRL